MGSTGQLTCKKVWQLFQSATSWGSGPSLTNYLYGKSCSCTGRTLSYAEGVVLTWSTTLPKRPQHCLIARYNYYISMRIGPDWVLTRSNRWSIEGGKYSSKLLFCRQFFCSFLVHYCNETFSLAFTLTLLFQYSYAYCTCCTPYIHAWYMIHGFIRYDGLCAKAWCNVLNLGFVAIRNMVNL